MEYTCRAMRGARQDSVLMGSSQSVISFVLLGLLVLGAQLGATLLRVRTALGSVGRSICSVGSTQCRFVTDRAALWRDVTVGGWVPTACDLSLGVTPMPFSPLVLSRIGVTRAAGRCRLHTGRLFVAPRPCRQAHLFACGRVGDRSY